VNGIADTGYRLRWPTRATVITSGRCAFPNKVTEPLLTCEPVLAETAFHLRNAGLVLEMVSDGFLALSFDCNDHLPQLAALAKRYADRQPDLADLCLIRMSELYPHHRVITADRDFRVYRRNKREVIPLISPP